VSSLYISVPNYRFILYIIAPSRLLPVSVRASASIRCQNNAQSLSTVTPLTIIVKAANKLSV
jgi:hypothetical protein